MKKPLLTLALAATTALSSYSGLAQSANLAEQLGNATSTSASSSVQNKRQEILNMSHHIAPYVKVGTLMLDLASERSVLYKALGDKGFSKSDIHDSRQNMANALQSGRIQPNQTLQQSGLVSKTLEPSAAHAKDKQGYSYVVPPILKSSSEKKRMNPDERFAYQQAVVQTKQRMESNLERFAKKDNHLFPDAAVALSKRESQHLPNAVNQLDYIGLFQFGASALETTGYLKKPSNVAKKQWDSDLRGNNWHKLKNAWAGKDDVHSVSDFKNNWKAQYNAAEALATYNWKQFEKQSLPGVVGDVSQGKFSDGLAIKTKEKVGSKVQEFVTPMTKTGVLFAKHLRGTGAVMPFLGDVKEGDFANVPSDQNRTTITEYMRLGAKAEGLDNQKWQQQLASSSSSSVMIISADSSQDESMLKKWLMAFQSTPSSDVSEPAELDSNIENNNNNKSAWVSALLPKVAERSAEAEVSSQTEETTNAPSKESVLAAVWRAGFGSEAKKESANLEKPTTNQNSVIADKAKIAADGRGHNSTAVKKPLETASLSDSKQENPAHANETAIETVLRTLQDLIFGSDKEQAQKNEVNPQSQFPPQSKVESPASRWQDYVQKPESDIGKGEGPYRS